MKEKNLVKYILYFFSYIFVYPCLYIPFAIILIMIVGSNPPKSTADLWGFIFWVVITIVGTWILNAIFKRRTKLKKNNMYSWLIVILHLILIPSSPYLLWLLTR
ncbi:hypothetical protein [Bacillus thuringiensis]|uniref:hypothetical protein n=1 Tax=Bacillus thuringiensis TaxID=1428 RepID=UPI003016CF10